MDSGIRHGGIPVRGRTCNAVGGILSMGGIMIFVLGMFLMFGVLLGVGGTLLYAIIRGKDEVITGKFIDTTPRDVRCGTFHVRGKKPGLRRRR